MLSPPRSPSISDKTAGSSFSDKTRIVIDVGWLEFHLGTLHHFDACDLSKAWIEVDLPSLVQQAIAVPTKVCLVERCLLASSVPLSNILMLLSIQLR